MHSKWVALACSCVLVAASCVNRAPNDLFDDSVPAEQGDSNVVVSSGNGMSSVDASSRGSSGSSGANSGDAMDGDETSASNDAGGSERDVAAPEANGSEDSALADAT